MGVQDLLFGVVNMLHMLSYGHHGGGVGGWWGVVTFLTSSAFTLRNMLPLLTCCTCCRMFIRGDGGVGVY